MTRDAKRLSLILLFAPFALWILLLIVLPHIGMVALSLREKVAPRVYEFGFGNYIDFLNEPIYWNTLLRTASMSLLVTALALLIGFPIAYYIAKIAGRRARGALFLMCLIPLWVSDLIRAFGWILLLRQTGVISSLLVWSGMTDEGIEFLYNDAAVIVGLVYTVILFMIVPLVSTLDGMGDDMIEAGYNLGGGHLTVLRRIIIPYAMPGIVAGCIVTFMLTAGSYLTPILLGGKNSSWFTEQIYNQFITRFNWESGAAFGFLLLAFTSITVWLGLRLSGQSLANTVART
ncbi:spermidine/putrescine ABC transporter permease [Rhodovulum viride]|uniref:Spermidine/putrescine ABC transporter permease n=1 Tax=Rhodovulum viride TaxID=1231134 RepID=A0ABX9DCG4_9RHOB|nr:ABC transporter permease [Rhodovulum viride]RAP39818.1 spermidine/putrescine ABC transporter permease [Rhodovulum viride]